MPMVFSQHVAWLAVGLAVCLSAPAVFAQDDDRTPAQLVELLGDPSYAVREAALAELARREFAAWEALEEGVKSSDLEVRYHCERLLEEIKEQARQRQLDEFVNQTDKTKKYDFPAWEKLRDVVGDTPSARKMYVDMYNEEPETLKALEAGKDIGGYVQTRVQRFFRTASGLPQTANSGNIAAMLFVAGQDGVTMTANGNSYLYSLCSQPAFREALSSPEQGQMIRKLLGRYIARGDDAMAYRGLLLAMQNDLKEEGLEAAGKMLQGKGGNITARYYAALAVAKLGSEEHIPLLRDALDDKTTVTSVSINGKMRQTQIRDIALFAMVHLSKQDYKEFGFDRVAPNPTMVANVATLAFENDQERDTALGKWNKFQETKKSSGDKSKPEQPAAEPAAKGDAAGKDQAARR